MENTEKKCKSLERAAAVAFVIFVITMTILITVKSEKRVSDDDVQTTTEVEVETEFITEICNILMITGEPQTVLSMESETTTEETVTAGISVESTEPVIATEPVVEDDVKAEEETVKEPVYTNVKYSDKNGDEVYFDTLEAAMAVVSVDTLTDAEYKAIAEENKALYAEYVSALVTLVNEYRAENGLYALEVDDSLESVAMYRAEESAYAGWNMTAYENNSTKRHIRPTFTKSSTIMDCYGLEGCYSEVFARFYHTPETVLAGWQASASHNALLLTDDNTKMGVGVAEDSDGYYYWIIAFN